MCQISIGKIPEVHFCPTPNWNQTASISESSEYDRFHMMAIKWVILKSIAHYLNGAHTALILGCVRPRFIAGKVKCTRHPIKCRIFLCRAVIKTSGRNKSQCKSLLYSSSRYYKPPLFISSCSFLNNSRLKNCAELLQFPWLYRLTNGEREMKGFVHSQTDMWVLNSAPFHIATIICVGFSKEQEFLLC